MADDDENKNRMDSMSSRFSRSNENADGDGDVNGDGDDSGTSESSGTRSQSEQTRNVKDRPHRTVYLPEQVDSELDKAVKTIEFEADTEHDISLGRHRHVLPFVVLRGVDAASEMEIDDVLDAMQADDRLVSPPE